MSQSSNYWDTDFKVITEMNARGECTDSFKMELVRKYDETFGTLLFEPSCERLRMSPFRESCGYFVGKSLVSDENMCLRGYEPRLDSIPSGCPFAVLKHIGGLA